MSEVFIEKTKTTTYKIMQVGIDMFTYNKKFRDIRERYKYKMSTCYSCNKRFEDGEKISLIMTNKGNKVVCHKCGEEIQHKLMGGENEDGTN